MTRSVINVGLQPNDGTGDPLRTAFQKTNANFAELYEIGVNVTVPQVNKGTVSGAVLITQSVGTEQKMTLGGAAVVTFTGFPTAGNYGEVELELVNGGSHTLTFGPVNWLLGDGTFSTSFSDLGVALQASGTNWIFVWSTNGGVTIWGKAL
jgi:hypothetical protein